MTATAQALAMLRAVILAFLRRHPVILTLLLVSVLTYSAVLVIPPPPGPAGLGLDASWQLGLNMARAQNFVFGRDIVFTYGPLGYLQIPDTVSGTPALALLFRIGLYAVVLLVLVRLPWILPSKAAVVSSALVIGLGAALDAEPAEDPVVFAFTVLAALVIADQSRWRNLELLLLALLATVALLVKLNQGIEACALLVVVLVTIRIQRTGRPAHPLLPIATFAVSAVLLFVLSTGSLLAFGPYLRYGWETVSGYSKAMAILGPPWQLALAVLMIGGVFIGLPLVAGDLRSLWPGFVPACIASFFIFKHAMVRQDGHANLFHVRFAVALLFLLMCARARDRRLVLLLQFFSLAMGCAIALPISELKARLSLRQATVALSAYTHWPSAWTAMGAQNERRRAQLRLPDRFHQVIRNQTVDAVPIDVQAVQANGWNWRPEPVFQFYDAWTPALDRLNAGHIESRRAADFVLLSFFAADYHHPFSEAPLSWRALLDRYDLKSASPGLLLLQHRPEFRFARPVLLGSETIHWGEDLRLPQTRDLLIVAPHIRLSLSGQFTAFLFRTTLVFMDGLLNSGRTFHFRCIWQNLAEGIVIQPFPQDLGELQALFDPDPDARCSARVASVSFRTLSPAQFASDIPVDWYRLPVKTASIPGVRLRTPDLAGPR